jgi:hypothetical protein
MKLGTVTSEAPTSATVRRGTFVAALTLLTAYNGFFDPAADSPWLSPFLDHTILWVCLGIGAYHLANDRRLVRFQDLVLATPALVCAAALSPMIVWMGLSATLCCFLFDTPSRRFRVGLLLSLAVALHEPGIGLIGYTVGDHLLDADQAVMATISPLLFYAADFFGTNSFQNKTEIVLVWGCTSVNNVSLALLLWSATTYTIAPRAPFRIWGFGLLLGGIVVTINVIRLVMMSIDLEHYRSIHDDPAGSVFRLAVLVSIFLITILSINYALRFDIQRR